MRRAGFVGGYVATILAAFHMAAAFAENLSFPLSQELPGHKGQYTALLLKVLNRWPTSRALEAFEMSQTLQASQSSHVEGQVSESMVLRCLETPEDDLYMGFEQFLRISASLEEVARVLDDIDSYQNLFPGLAETRILKKEGNLWTTYWEQRIPLFFVPNVKYEMSYLILPISAERRIYRYQLKSSKDLTQSDGIIVLDREGPMKTRYSEYDFYNAHWGLAKAMGKSRLWHENAEGVALSDLAIKLKAEHRDKSQQWARDEAEKLLKKSKLNVSCDEKTPARAIDPGPPLK